MKNEICSEREPYDRAYRKFAGRGVYGCVMYAKEGNRPSMHKKTPEATADLIKKCWHSDPKIRPSFKTIVNQFIIDPSLNMPGPDFAKIYGNAKEAPPEQPKIVQIKQKSAKTLAPKAPQAQPELLVPGRLME